VSCGPFTGDHTRPSPRLPPGPNNEHPNDARDKDGALVTMLAEAVDAIIGTGTHRDSHEVEIAGVTC